MKKYTQPQIRQIEKRIDLILDFSLFAINYPAIISSMKNGAHVALLPEDNIELARENFELAVKADQKDHKGVEFFVGEHSKGKTISKRKIESKKEAELAWR